MAEHRTGTLIQSVVVLWLVCGSILQHTDAATAYSYNIAQGKPTWQKGTWDHFGSDLAVDGNITQVPDSACALPDALEQHVSGRHTWWSVDLAGRNKFKEFMIENVTIYFRPCCPEFSIIGVLILVGSTPDVTSHQECAKVTTGESIQTLPCHPSSPVTFLTVMHPTHPFMGLCEVIVNGHDADITWPLIGIAAIALGTVSLIIIITIVIIRKRREATPVHDTSPLQTKKVPTPDNEYGVPEIIQPMYEEIGEKGRFILPTEKTHVVTNDYEELPDATQPLYEEIHEQGLSTYGEYALLNTQNMYNQWIVDNHIDLLTQEKLQQHGITTIQDVRDLSYLDMIEIGLNVGERNRIKRAMNKVFKKY